MVNDLETRLYRAEPFDSARDFDRLVADHSKLLHGDVFEKDWEPQEIITVDGRVLYFWK